MPTVTTFVTDLADQAVVLPLLGAVAATLALQRQWHAAATWLLGIGIPLSAVLLLKVSIAACGWRAAVLGPGLLDLHSPSGHAAAAAAVVGSTTILLAPRRARLAFGLSLLGAAAVGLTRLLLGVHSPAEVLVGGAAGVAGTGLVARVVRPAPPVRVAPLLAAMVVATILFHGRHLPAETVIQGRGAAMLRAALPACVPPLHP